MAGRRHPRPADLIRGAGQSQGPPLPSTSHPSPPTPLCRTSLPSPPPLSLPPPPSPVRESPTSLSPCPDHESVNDDSRRNANAITTISGVRPVANSQCTLTSFGSRPRMRRRPPQRWRLRIPGHGLGGGPPSGRPEHRRRSIPRRVSAPRVLGPHRSRLAAYSSGLNGIR